jgi:hypothetical protein
VLDGIPDAELRIFVVWQPVLRTDVAPPTSGVLGRITDPRAAQFWDRRCILSERIAAAAVEDPQNVLGQTSCSSGEVVWDWVAVYPPGVRWDDRYPQAAFAGAPVVGVMHDVRDELTDLAGSQRRGN